MIWQAVATSIEFFVDTGDDQKIKVRDGCIQFVAACHNPEQVMVTLMERIVTDDRSDSQADTMELKLDAMSVFKTNRNPVIVAAALWEVAEVRNRIGGLRERERLRDAAREQTFD